MKKCFNFKLAVMSACIVALLSFPALAENFGPYVTANIGYSQLELDLANSDGGGSSQAFSFGIGFGFNEYIAIEAGWLDAGKTSESTSTSSTGIIFGKSYTITGTGTADYKAQGLYFGPIVSVPLGKFKAYAKAGVYFWSMDANLSATGSLIYDGTTYAANTPAEESKSGNDSYFGLGASYDITEQFTVRTDWASYHVDDFDIDVFAVGIVFKFDKLFGS